MNHVKQATNDATCCDTIKATRIDATQATAYATRNGVSKATYEAATRAIRNDIWDATDAILQFTDRANSEFTSSLWTT